MSFWGLRRPPHSRTDQVGYLDSKNMTDLNKEIKKFSLSTKK